MKLVKNNTLHNNETGKTILDQLMTALEAVTSKYEFEVLRDEKDFSKQRYYLFEKHPDLYKEFIYEWDMRCVKYIPMEMVD